MTRVSFPERGNWEVPFCPVPFDSLENLIGTFQIVKDVPPVLAFASANGLFENLAGMFSIFL